VNKVDEYVTIRQLPELHSLEAVFKGQLGILTKKKGSATFLNNGSVLAKFVAVLEFKTGYGARGNHYHESKHEYMCLISGKLRGQYWLSQDPTIRKEVVVTPGSFIAIKPGLAHAYVAQEDSIAVEFSPQTLDPGDEFDTENPWC